MNGLKLDNKNLINNYQPTPTLNYDIEGVLLEKNGKDIKVGKTIDNKVIEYSLRLKEEAEEKVGENIKVDKENILSSKMEEKKDKKPEISKENSRAVEDILMELGLEFSSENIKMVEELLRSGIQLNKTSIKSYVKSKEYLDNIIENIDTDSYVKLMEQGIDLGEENLKDISDEIDRIKNRPETFSIKKFLKLDRELNYKEAEAISKEIYGQKMGKDVYDTIISLHSESVEITRDNIEDALDIMRKLNDLKNIENDSYIKLLKEDGDFTIDNLFRIKNSYTTNNLVGDTRAGIFEESSIMEEANLDSLKELLDKLEIEDSMDNLAITREFIINNMPVTRENHEKIIHMKNSLEEIRQLLDSSEVSRLIKEGIDPSKEDIDYLIEALKNKNIISDNIPMDSNKREEVLKNLMEVGRIEDRDLLKLIREGLDLNLDSIKEIVDNKLDKTLDIQYKTLDKTMELDRMFTSIGEDFNRQLIPMTIEKHGEFNLRNLYEVSEELNKIDLSESTVMENKEIDFLYDEYLKAKNSLSTNIIRESIKDARPIERMPIPDLNKYIEKKINRYREIDQMTREIKEIGENGHRILPIIMKNDIAMTISEIKNMNEFLNGNKGLVRTLENMEKSGNYSEELKMGIKTLKKTISDALKEGSEGVKNSYSDLLNTMENSRESFGEGSFNQSEENKYLRYRKKISKRDTIVQLPVEIGSGYKDLNLIIPDTNKKIDKNNMNFLVSLNSDRLGMVGVELNIVGRDIELSIDESKTNLVDNISILEDRFNRLGYRLKLREY